MNIPDTAIHAAREHLPHPNLHKALEAAAPHIAAEQLRLTADEIDAATSDTQKHLREVMRAITGRLRKQAADLDSKEN